jgi:tetratricopeptide (TPR) repeat protein
LNLIRLGRPGDTIKWVERAFALSPRDPLRSVWYGAISRAHVLTGEDLLAVETARKGVAANRNHGNNYANLAAALAYLGRMDEARAAVKDFERVQPGITVSRYQRNVASKDPTALEVYERLMNGLRKAGLPE